jgi:hypothetical protein
MALGFTLSNSQKSVVAIAGNKGLWICYAVVVALGVASLIMYQIDIKKQQLVEDHKELPAQ